MQNVKSNAKSKCIRDKNYDKIKISDLPAKFIKSIQEITLASDKDSLCLVNSAIAAREVTNNVDDLERWLDEHLAKKTIIIAETEKEYFDIVYSAILSLPNQFSKGVAKKERCPVEMTGNKTGGYFAEFAFQKLAKRIGVEINLAHQMGNLKQFIDSDFPSVIEKGKKRKSKINVGAKSGKKNSLWMDVPTAQFKNTDYQVFGRCVTDGKHLGNRSIDCLINHNPYLKDRHYPKEVTRYIKSLSPKPISVYLAGFAAKPENKIFSYKGYKAKTIFHITEINGFVPADYKEIVRQREELSTDFKVEILCIEKFTNHKGGFYAWNSGSILKTSEQMNELIRKL